MAQKIPSGVRGVVVAWSITLVWEPCGMCWGQRWILVQGKVGIALAQSWPLFSSFLHPVFPEHALARRDQRRDAFSRVGLADGHQGHIRRLATGNLCGAGNAGMNLGERGGWISHGAVL